MTQGRALLLLVFDAYAGPDRAVSPQVAHNLAFLLQEAGEPLHLTFEPGPRGLRAAGLTAVLRRIDGHFIADYDPSHEGSPLRLYAEAIGAARDALSGAPKENHSFKQVRTLIENQDAPDQLELLATVGWLTKHNMQARRRPEAAVRAIQDWSRRKAERFAPEQITAVWRRLRRHGWVDAASSTDSE